jgi:hypothetical protein
VEEEAAAVGEEAAVGEAEVAAGEILFLPRDR